MAFGNFMEKKANLIVVFLLLLLFIQAVTSIKNKSITVDEISHISSGYSYIKTGDFRLNPEALPLVDMLSALPLLFLNPKLPLDHESWEKAKYNELEGQYHWEFGEQFFFHYNDNADQILFFGRIFVILLSVLLGFFVFKWAKELFGIKPGLFALFLYSFSPNILAHSRIATIDLGAACFMFIAAYYFWRFINNITLKSLAIAGITFGLAQLSKFTALYLIPIYIILTLIVVYTKRKKDTKFFNVLFGKKSRTLFSLLLILFVIGFVVVIFGYFIKGFPAYIDGLTYTVYHSTVGHPSYLMGQHSTDGWWYYFFVAFFIKTPIPTLVFLLLTLIFFRKMRHKEIMNEFFLIVPIIFLFSVFIFNNMNIGLRHILPIYPFLFVFTSRLINFKKLKILVILLALWYLVGALFIYPHYLAYFNEFIGGPNNGDKYLLDSNIDWGQDLKGLKNYMDKNNIQHIILGYWGKDDIAQRGISYKQVSCYPEPGLIAVSVNNLHGIKEERSECLKWLKGYNPITKIGYTIFIYNITEEIDLEYEAFKFCEEGCAKRCSDIDLSYFNSSYYNDSCQCECTE